MISFSIISFMTNGFTHHCHLGESIVILGASEVILNFVPLFDEIHVRAVPELTIWGGLGGSVFVFLCMVGFH